MKKQRIYELRCQVDNQERKIKVISDLDEEEFLQIIQYNVQIVNSKDYKSKIKLE